MFQQSTVEQSSNNVSDAKQQGDQFFGGSLVVRLWALAFASLGNGRSRMSTSTSIINQCHRTAEKKPPGSRAPICWVFDCFWLSGVRVLLLLAGSPAAMERQMATAPSLPDPW